MDFFLAVQLCSLVPVFFDMTYSFCFFFTGAFLEDDIGGLCVCVCIFISKSIKVYFEISHTRAHTVTIRIGDIKPRARAAIDVILCVLCRAVKCLLCASCVARRWNSLCRMGIISKLVNCICSILLANDAMFSSIS